ncbi:unnamed protein product [Parajaminaea phylloscopi]
MPASLPLLAALLAAAATVAPALTIPTCPTINTGYGPRVWPDTDAKFVAATNDVLAGVGPTTPVPAGYTSVFTRKNAAAFSKGWYSTQTLKAYDVQACADYCTSQPQCASFNIYYERVPMMDPVKCPLTPSTTIIQCVAHSYALDDKPRNDGQWRGKFHVVESGSAGYNRQPATTPTTPAPIFNPPSVDGFAAPVNLGVCTVRFPLDPVYVDATTGKNLDTYMGVKAIPSVAYRPELCAQACQDITAGNKARAGASGLYQTCNYFSAYLLVRNSDAGILQCAFYSSADWAGKEKQYSDNCGYGNGADKYTISNSATYAIKPYDPIASRTDVFAVKKQGLTFETDTFVAPDTLYGVPSAYESNTTDTLYLDQVYGFAGSYYDDYLNRNKYSVSIVRRNIPRSLPMATGQFATCGWAAPCKLTAKGFTFDVNSISVGDFGLSRGRLAMSGLRNGQTVARWQATVAKGDRWQQVTLPDFKNIDTLSFDNAPTYFSWDNLDVTKYTRPGAITKRDGEVAASSNTTVAAANDASATTMLGSLEEYIAAQLGVEPDTIPAPPSRA